MQTVLVRNTFVDLSSDEADACLLWRSRSWPAAFWRVSSIRILDANPGFHSTGDVHGTGGRPLKLPAEPSGRDLELVVDHVRRRIHAETTERHRCRQQAYRRLRKRNQRTQSERGRCSLQRMLDAENRIRTLRLAVDYVRAHLCRGSFTHQRIWAKACNIMLRFAMIRTCEVPRKLTFHTSLASVLQITLADVQAAIADHPPAPVDSSCICRCVVRLQQLMPAGLLCFCLPDIGVLHFRCNGTVITLTPQQLMHILQNVGAQCVALALYGTSVSHHARPAAVALPVHEKWCAPKIAAHPHSQLEMFTFRTGPTVPLRTHTLCIGHRGPSSGTISANELLELV